MMNEHMRKAEEFVKISRECDIQVKVAEKNVKECIEV